MLFFDDPYNMAGSGFDYPDAAPNDSWGRRLYCRLSKMSLSHPRFEKDYVTQRITAIALILFTAVLYLVGIAARDYTTLIPASFIGQYIPIYAAVGILWLAIPILMNRYRYS